jgi:hypothetical protein
LIFRALGGRTKNTNPGGAEMAQSPEKGLAFSAKHLQFCRNLCGIGHINLDVWLLQSFMQAVK